MNVSPVSSSATTSSTTASGAASEQDQFLQLLITQIQNQNPLDPLDNAQFTSQLSQFAMLEELQQMNTSLEQNMVYSQSLNNTMLLGLVGKHAVVEGDGVSVAAGEVSSSQVQVPATGLATIEVLNESGTVVATYTREVAPGWNDVTWDGREDDGDAAGDGSYTVSISVADRGGNGISAVTYMSGIVESIRFENNLALLHIAGRDYYASEIAKVGI
ncbi:flagellar hook assembly protein FlgD [bacterium]|nr:flagellar hook assembly protein FlgD [bacterium]MBU1674557.1 flagellar hook assembly protein FlgD [bacterium]